MKIAVAQINSHLGSFESNKKKVLQYIQKAQKAKCQLVVFPEGALYGYYPEDLFELQELVKKQEKVIQSIHSKLPPKLSVILGAFVKNSNSKGRPFFNVAVLLEKNKPLKYVKKSLMAADDVFNEDRFIQESDDDPKKNILKIQGQNVLVSICEDMWVFQKGKDFRNRHKDNFFKKIKSPIDLFINISASPYKKNREEDREGVYKEIVNFFKVPLIYCNMVGGQDALIFEGASSVMNEKGKFLFKAKRFEEDFLIYDTKKSYKPIKIKKDSENEELRQALVLGVRDFFKKTGAKKAHLGLSGGIDSALVACLVCEALGKNNVKLFWLEGPHSSKESVTLARKISKNLKITLKEISVVSLYEEQFETFKSLYKKPASLVLENFQARLRGLFLMGVSNQEGSLLINCSNKSEFAVGYFTLYGDSCGALAPIGDLLKTEVYELAKLYKKIIPLQVFRREPTAELRPNQKDSQSLPPYSQLDPMLEKFILKGALPKTALEKKIFKLLLNSEFKRLQAPPILKVSCRAFGQGRVWPIAQGLL